jgi:hypothetical protein
MGCSAEDHESREHDDESAPDALQVQPGPGGCLSPVREAFDQFAEAHEGLAFFLPSLCSNDLIFRVLLGCAAFHGPAEKYSRTTSKVNSARANSG